MAENKPDPDQIRKRFLDQFDRQEHRRQGHLAEEIEKQQQKQQDSAMKTRFRVILIAFVLVILLAVAFLRR